jgi:hypothetical protein
MANNIIKRSGFWDEAIYAGYVQRYVRELTSIHEVLSFIYLARGEIKGDEPTERISLG